MNTAVAQDTPANKQKSGLTVTATASTDRVRFTAPSSVIQIRIEVYNSTGKKLFDNELRGGNVLDWHLLDGQAEEIADDSYLCVITVKSLSGKLTQRIGSVRVEKNTAIVQAATASQMTAQQTESIGPVEDNASVVVLKEGETQTATVIAHNGTEGQLIRGQGALSFRLGDFFAGIDKEQMRLTEEGNLGIGTATPQARLDVAGMNRTDGLILPDGSILTSVAPIAGLPDGSPDLNGTIANLGRKKNGQIHTEAFGQISGDGTANAIAKFTGANSIANSALVEVNGNVGIGTANPGGQLHIFGTATTDVFAGMGPDVINGPALNFGYAGFSFGRGAGFFNVRPDASAVSPNPSLRFATANVERMIITNTGNIGIGTSNPLRTLQIGANTDALFTISPEDIAPNAGFIRFGDKTGWKLHFARSRESSGGALNTGTTGELMTIQDNGNVGLSNTNPTFRLHVVDPSNTGLRVQTNSAGGTVASFGGSGDFQIDAVNVPGGRLIVKENGQVGIGTTNLPTARLTVMAPANTFHFDPIFGATEGQTGISVVGGSKNTNNVGFGGAGLIAIGGDASNGGFSGEGLVARAGFANAGSGSANGLAASFHGEVSIFGDLLVTGTKNFRIDHPLDPENKYLLHAAIESSEVLRKHFAEHLV